jgi:3-oxoacyl-[acyl-carrier protein] reductase
MNTSLQALVTGGTGSLGEAICVTLAAQGHHVLVHTHRQLDKAEKICETIRELGGLASAIQFDVTQAESCKQILEQWVAERGAIQVLINNSGIHDDAVMPAMKPSQWHEVIDVSLNGFFNVTQPLLMPMIGTRFGRIVNITSISGLMGNRGQTNYSAAKAGLHGATKSLALELASRGITVNAVAPGIISSPMADASFDKAMIEKIVPMKRSGTPQEVADLVAFLVSSKAAYISGQVISINGGMA